MLRTPGVATCVHLREFGSSSCKSDLFASGSLEVLKSSPKIRKLPKHQKPPMDV